MSTRISLKAITTILFIGLFMISGISQNQDVTIKWMSLEEAYQKSKIEKRKIFVELYTDYCKWCKKMDVVTFNDPDVVRYLNEKYYAVKLNGETKEDIYFMGEKYKFVHPWGKKNGHHELVMKLTDGKIGYPTIIFLDEKFQSIQAMQGFREPAMFLAFISYIGQDFQKKMPWNQFYSNYIRQVDKP